MANYVDQTVQEANVLHAKALKYQAQLTSFGVSAEELASLITARDILVSKDTTQKELTNTAKAKTIEQNAALKAVGATLKKIKEIAKIVYDENKEILEEFHIGSRPIRSVKKAITELAYMKELCTRRKDDLTARGMTEDDLTTLDAHITNLTTIDNDQEMAKRNKVTATSERSAANKELKKIIKRIRKSAEVCFADNTDILHEFKRLD